MTHIPLSRRSDIDPFIVMDVMSEARRLEAEGRRIVHMEIGEPGTGVPQAARAAFAQDLSRASMGYTVALGLPELRQKIAGLYDSWYGIDLDPGRIIVTAGASGAFILAFTALFDAGARVGVGEPGYPSYRQILRALSLCPVGVQTSVENRLQPVPADLENVDISGLIVASPGNPSGTMLGHEAMAALMEHCKTRGVHFISDEIYHGLHYGPRGVSALEISDDAWVINSFSKYFCMTGWRVGWMVAPEAHVRKIERLAQNMFICPPHASQRLAFHAMDHQEELSANHIIYSENRSLMMAGLLECGFDQIAPPDGAFYIYADISHLSTDSLAFAREILREAGVAVTPGVDFDPIRGHHMLRFSYAGATTEIIEGLARLKGFMAQKGFIQSK